MHWYLDVLRKYARFEGRARRTECWCFLLFNAAFALAFAVIDLAIRHMTGVGFGALASLYALAILVPAVAVGVRRLHDTNRSGWWLLLALVPVAGFLLLFLLSEDSTPGTNRYGGYPKYVST